MDLTDDEIAIVEGTRMNRGFALLRGFLSLCRLYLMGKKQFRFWRINYVY